MLWFVFQPLLRARRNSGIQPSDVYRAQLAEVEREAEAGLLSDADATGARAEIARRLLRASEAAQSSKDSDKPIDPRITTIAITVFVIVLSLGGYLWLGNPGLPSQPFAARDLASESAARLGPAAQELERRLGEIEDPAERARFLANALLLAGALPEAIEGYLRVLSYLPEDADALTRIGEIQLAEADGIVNEDIVTWFDRALVSEPLMPRANYYRALFDYQQADFAVAQARLDHLLETAPADAPWIAQVSGLRDEARRAQEGVPGGAEEMLALDEDARTARIREMVAGLAARLEQSPTDFEGWLRLANAYAVLDQRTEAGEALLRAGVLAQGEPLLEARVAEIAAAHDLPLP